MQCPGMSIESLQPWVVMIAKQQCQQWQLIVAHAPVDEGLGQTLKFEAANPHPSRQGFRPL